MAKYLSATPLDTQPTSSILSGKTDKPATDAAVPIRSRVLKIALPSIGENLLLTSLMIVDTLMIARFGPIALAAAAMAGILIWRSQMTFGCIDKGTMALTSRYFGAGHIERAARGVAQSVIVAVLIGIGMAVVAFYGASTALRWMKADSDVLAAGTPYLIIIGAASIPRMVFAVVATSFRATGDTKTPMWITLWMNVINIILNFPLIYGIPAIPSVGFEGTPALGLTGSGISTGLALLFSASAATWIVLSGRAVYKFKLSYFRPDFGIMKTLLRVSFPSFIEEALISVGFLVYFRFIAVLGTAALAAHAIASRIEALSFMAGVGFAIAAAALVGQALGKKDLHEARDAFRITTKFCVGIMSVIAVILILLSGPIVSLFAPGSAEIQEMAALLVVIAAIEQPLLGIGMTLGGGLRGAGDTVTPMISTLICSIGIRVGASYWFAFTLGYGIYGIYLGTMVDWLVRSILLYAFFRWERWTRIKL